MKLRYLFCEKCHSSIIVFYGFEIGLDRLLTDCRCTYMEAKRLSMKWNLTLILIAYFYFRMCEIRKEIRWPFFNWNTTFIFKTQHQTRAWTSFLISHRPDCLIMSYDIVLKTIMFKSMRLCKRKGKVGIQMDTKQHRIISLSEVLLSK